MEGGARTSTKRSAIQLPRPMHVSTPESYHTVSERTQSSEGSPESTDIQAASSADLRPAPEKLGQRMKGHGRSGLEFKLGSGVSRLLCCFGVQGLVRVWVCEGQWACPGWLLIAQVVGMHSYQNPDSITHLGEETSYRGRFIRIHLGLVMSRLKREKVCSLPTIMLLLHRKTP